MASQGFGYYYGRALLDSGDLSSYISFNTNSGAIAPVESGDSSHYGIIHGPTGNFWSEYGSGFFSGNLMSLNDTEALPTDNFSILLVFEKPTPSSQILFSTLKSGANPSGFVFGVNDASRFYVESYDADRGCFLSSSFDMPVANKNGIVLGKNGNSFALNKYLFSERKTYSERISFPFSVRSNSNLLTLGGGSGLPADIPNNYFSGYIDEFAFIDQTINAANLDILFSGIYKNETGSLDYQFLNTFTMNGVALKNALPSESKMELCSFGFSGSGVFNKPCGLDYASGLFYIKGGYSGRDILFYENGIHYKTGDISISGRFISNEVLSDRLDAGLFDFYPGVGIVVTISGGDFVSGVAICEISGDSMLFLNGQKLVSGIDYTVSGGLAISLTNQYSGMDCDIWTHRFQSGVLSQTRDSNAQVLSLDFAEKSSLFYLNGVRQFLDQDYVEINSNSLVFDMPPFYDRDNLPIFNSENFVA